MRGAGQCAIRNRIAVDILVAGEAAGLFKLLGVEDLAARDGLFGIVEGLGHPVVHAEVEVGEDEDRGLQRLGKIEGLHAKLEALPDGAREQQDVLGVAVGEAGR